MAAINAAAVTKQYRVEPHLGEETHTNSYLNYTHVSLDYRTVSAINGY